MNQFIQMENNKTVCTGITGKAFLLLVLTGLSSLAHSQTDDSSKFPGHLSGAVTVTNNGISFIPTFTLGKPAAIFDMSVGKRVCFEPQFRFALEGKPWSILLWWRYKAVKTDKFIFNIGAHPGLAFKTVTSIVEGNMKEDMVVHRYLAGELSPNYFVAKNVSIGVYYLYSHGFDPEAIRNTHFITLNSNISDIKLTRQFYLKLNPQVYYLRMKGKDGYYVSSVFTLANKKIPIAVSSLLNKVIKTSVPGSKDFVWNVSLTYLFNNRWNEPQKVR
jgi:hypothetical protein